MSSQEESRLDKLIAIEWDIIKELKGMLADTKLSPAEKTRAGNAVAYHASVLNKLLNQKGENDHFDEATLGDFVRTADSRMRRTVRRDFRTWTRRLSSYR